MRLTLRILGLPLLALESEADEASEYHEIGSDAMPVGFQVAEDEEEDE